jgi:hypothetical protein
MMVISFTLRNANIVKLNIMQEKSTQTIAQILVET